MNNNENRNSNIEFDIKAALDEIHKGLAEDDAYELSKNMFDSIIQKLLLIIKKEAITKNDKDLLEEIDDALYAAEKFHKMDFGIIKPDGFENWDKGKQLDFLTEICEYDFIIDEMVRNSSTEPYIDSTTNYMACNMINSCFEFTEPDYSETSVYARELIIDALKAFDNFNSLFRYEITIFNICEYTFTLRALIENISTLTDHKRKTAIKKKINEKSQEDKRFFEEMQGFVKECNGRITEALEKYFEKHRDEQLNKYKRKIGNWIPTATKSRLSSLSRDYYRLKTAYQKKIKRKFSKLC